ncbi:MAG: SPOR domain-containing protein [Spirochaetaceae bacterium]|jgi:cell division septation protein DedD|nr:SPOR domain-containing protein [Spirochaetaceae bacterium]
MEKKKLLLVSVAVGLFLVIVIGASVLVFSPRDYNSVTRTEAVPAPSGISQAAPATAARPPAVSEQPAESPATTAAAATSTAATTTAVTTAAVTTTAPEEVLSKNERSLENIIYITASGNVEDAVRVERLNDGNTKTYITIPAPRETAVSVPAAVPVASAPPPAAAARSPAATVPAATMPAQKPVAPKPPAVAKAENVKASSSWWVQTNSYSKKAYADDAKKFLETKGITSVVTNGNVGGKIYYRVRVGPYSSQAEADYWLSLIKNINGMENSLVWKTSSL